MHQHDKDNSQTVKHYVHCLSHPLKERHSDFELALDDEEQIISFDCDRRQVLSNRGQVMARNLCYRNHRS